MIAQALAQLESEAAVVFSEVTGAGLDHPLGMFVDGMKRLARKLGVNFAKAGEADAQTAQQNDYSGSPPLSENARRLREWYRQASEFYRCCKDRIRTRICKLDRSNAPDVA